MALPPAYVHAIKFTDETNKVHGGNIDISPVNHVEIGGYAYAMVIIASPYRLGMS